METIVWEAVHADGTIEIFKPWRNGQGNFVIVPLRTHDPNLPTVQIEVDSEAKLADRARTGLYYILMASDREVPILIAPEVRSSSQTN